MKKCSRCQQKLSEDQFYKLKGDRTQSYCKVCAREYQRAYKHRPKRPKKQCSRCLRKLPFESFHQCRESEDGRFHECSVCVELHLGKNQRQSDSVHYDQYLGQTLGRKLSLK